MTQINFPGMNFFLSDNGSLIRKQLAGEEITLKEAMPLRDDVSTDEMTSQKVAAKFQQTGWGSGLLSSFRAGDGLPIPYYAFDKLGCEVMVGGKRYGKGSSREHSPMAHKSVGIRLIIAESFERIFRQNCDNLGIFTSTDFDLIGRIRGGKSIDIEDLVSGREPLAAELLRHGGLLAYGQKLDLLADVKIDVKKPEKPKNLTEKILARHAIAGIPIEVGKGTFVKADWRFSHEYYTGTIATIIHDQYGKPAPIYDPKTIRLFEDHLTFARRSKLHIKNDLLPGVDLMSQGHRQFGEEYGLVNHGVIEEEGSEGICHALLIERYALPGQVVTGTDSHTTHSGALGCLAFGAGSTDIALSYVTGAIRLTVPETILIRLNGSLSDGITAKDVLLHLLAMPELKAGSGLGMVFEFVGSAVESMSVDERATLTNMVAELGGFTGIIAPDEKTVEFIRERRGVEFEIEDWMQSDPGAQYAETIELNVSKITPFVAAPGDPGNGLPLSEIGKSIDIDIAYAGSCTGGKREDFDHYHEVLDWALKHGLKVHPDVSLFLQFGSLAVRDYCIEKGYINTFEAMGVEILNPSCGACAGCGPGTSESAQDVTVSSINRNFPGRSGPGNVWLASPPTVMASAIAGHIISFDDLKKSTCGVAS